MHKLKFLSTFQAPSHSETMSVEAYLLSRQEMIRRLSFKAFIYMTVILLMFLFRKEAALQQKEVCQ